MRGGLGVMGVPRRLLRGREMGWGGANAMPKEAVRLYDLYRAGRLAEALALWRLMQPLNKLLWTLPFNPVAKAAANLSGRPVGECRRGPAPPGQSFSRSPQVSTCSSRLRSR